VSGKPTTRVFERDSQTRMPCRVEGGAGCCPNGKLDHKLQRSRDRIAGSSETKRAQTTTAAATGAIAIAYRIAAFPVFQPPVGEDCERRDLDEEAQPEVGIFTASRLCA
jgi:hypothetical protein